MSNKLWNIIENSVSLHGSDRFLYEEESGRKHAYSDLKRDAEKLAFWLMESFSESAHIGMIDRSSYAFLIVFFACMRSGMIFVALDSRSPEEDLIDDLRQSDVDLAIFREGQTIGEKIGLCRMISFEEIMEQSKNISGELKKTRPIPPYSMLFFTSGVSGHKKCVMLSDENVYYNTAIVCDSAHFTGDNTSLLSVLPFSHIYGLCCGALSALIVTADLYITGYPEQFAKCIRKYNPSMTMLTPQIIQYLYRSLQWNSEKNPEIPKDILKERILGNHLNVIISGGAYLDREIVLSMREFGIEVLQGYGMTECSPQIASNSFCENHPGTVGQVLPGTELRIQEGEICVKGPGVMKGYYKDPEGTSDAIEDGWFRTGDLGVLDEEGYLQITGRKKNLIVLSNGENIPAELLENELLSFSEIEECVVFEKNDLIHAMIVPSEMQSIEKEDVYRKIKEIITSVNNSHPSYSRIYRWELRDTPFEKTTSGKIRRTVKQ